MRYILFSYLILHWHKFIHISKYSSEKKDFSSFLNTERQRDRETERQRDRETERQRDRETERQRYRETERQINSNQSTSKREDRERERVKESFQVRKREVCVSVWVRESMRSNRNVVVVAPWRNSDQSTSQRGCCKLRLLHKARPARLDSSSLLVPPAS